MRLKINSSTTSEPDLKAVNRLPIHHVTTPTHTHYKPL